MLDTSITTHAHKAVSFNLISLFSYLSPQHNPTMHAEYTGTLDMDTEESSARAWKRSSSSVGGPPMPKLTSEEACEHEHELELDRSVHAKPSGASASSLRSRSSPPPRRSLYPNADSRSAISAGRALLNRPAAAQASSAPAISANGSHIPV